MTVIFIEGFDKYGPPGTKVGPAQMGGEWNSGGGSIAAPLSTTGGAFYGTLFRSFDSHYTTFVGGTRFNVVSYGAELGLAFSIGSSGIEQENAQCSIRIENNTGRISVLRGGLFLGTVLGTSTTSVSENSVHYLEWKITIGTSGHYEVWLDGISILSGTGNTQNISGGGNNYMDGMYIGLATFQIYWDDMYLFDTMGDINNDVLLTSPRIETTFPTQDTQTQWTNGGSVIGWARPTYSGSLLLANRLFLRRFQCQGTGASLLCSTISTITQTTNVTAKFKGCLYADSAGAPGALLSGGSEVVGVTANLILNLPITPHLLTEGDYYWIGVLADTNFQMTEQYNQYDISPTLLGYVATRTYASGLPDPAPTMTAGSPSYMMWGSCTGSDQNFVSVNQNPAAVGSYVIGSSDIDGPDISYIFGDVVGTEDYYSFTPLSVTPTEIYTVAVKTLVKHTDTGLSKAYDLECNLTDVVSTGDATDIVAPSGSYGWGGSNFETDPNGDAWTKTTLDATTTGIVITT